MAHRAIYKELISWKPPPLTFFKINFDNNMMESDGGAGFVVRGPDLRLVAARDSWLFESSILGAELRAAWIGIAYMRLTL